MSLIFEALQKLDRRRAGLDSHPKLEMADLSEDGGRKTMPRWESDPAESNGEVPYSEYAETARFTDLAPAEVSSDSQPAAERFFDSPAITEAAHEEPIPVGQIPGSPVLVERVPVDTAPVNPAPAIRPLAATATVASIPGFASLTVKEAPIELPVPAARTVSASLPPRPAPPADIPAPGPVAIPSPAPVAVHVPAPAAAPVPARAHESSPARPRPSGNLASIVEQLADLRTQQRELRELGTERKASLLRLGDHLDGVRLSSDRNTLEQHELFKELRGIGKKINYLVVAGLVLTAASLALSCALYLRFLNVIH